ncbi:MAG: glutamate--tRNA ligase [Candidatus Heimdallarchaeota archaeon]|nr:glutamate--tRNA ligase [Candidatus Heimdallarchaeota archaeon]
MSDEINDLVLKYCLANAVHYNGKASEKSVMQTIMATHTDLRKQAKLIKDLVDEIVPTVNSFSTEKQIKELTKIAPEMLEKRETAKRVYELPPLKDAIEGKVVTRYAPEPNGDMHLGHAFTAFFAHYYADKYKGTFILRFEDTNPKQEKLEFMDAHREALKWLGLPPTKEVIVSNDVPIFYEKAEQLIKNNHAYTCTCSAEKIRELRGDMILCEHRTKSSTDTMKEWKRMLVGEYAEGDIVLRLKGDMESENAVMRDPAIFTIRKDKHCLQGTKYSVWPLYDFAVAIEDFICGISHVGRSAEFDTRIELQNKIRDLLGLVPHPEIFHYARFNVTGSPASKRKIIPLVSEGKVEGWDDIRLVTIKGMQRRGILPETIKQIALEVGMTTQPTNIDWSLISATNRKLIDLQANRYFFVPDPILLYVINSPSNITCKIPLHPDDDSRGTRKINPSSFFLISKSDFDILKTGDEFRLKDLYNVKITKKKADLDIILKENDVSDEYLKSFLKRFKIFCTGSYNGKELKPGAKIQWTVADPKETVPVEVKIPDVLFIEDKYNENSLTIVNGFGEKAIGKLQVDDIVQFERFGFVRIDNKVKDKVFANRTHK